MATSARRPAGLPGERRFHLAMAAALLLTIAAGFGPVYYFAPALGRPVALAPLTPLVHVHAAIFSAWVLLFAVQTGLVSAGRLSLHRRIGPVALGLLVAMVAVAVLTGLHGAVRASGPPGIDPLSWLAVTLMPIPVFAALILAALHLRRDPQAHKRLMLYAMIAMIVPATARIFPGMTGLIAVPALFLVPMVARDLATRKRLHPVTVWAAPLVLLSFVAPFLVWNTAPWLAFARWAMRLVA